MVTVAMVTMRAGGAPGGTWGTANLDKVWISGRLASRRRWRGEGAPRRFRDEQRGKRDTPEIHLAYLPESVAPGHPSVCVSLCVCKTV